MNIEIRDQQGIGIHLPHQWLNVGPIPFQNQSLKRKTHHRDVALVCFALKCRKKIFKPVSTLFYFIMDIYHCSHNRNFAFFDKFICPEQINLVLRKLSFT